MLVIVLIVENMIYFKDNVSVYFAHKKGIKDVVWYVNRCEMLTTFDREGHSEIYEYMKRTRVYLFYYIDIAMWDSTSLDE